MPGEGGFALVATLGLERIEGRAAFARAGQPFGQRRLVGRVERAFLPATGGSDVERLGVGLRHRADHHVMRAPLCLVAGDDVAVSERAELCRDRRPFHGGNPPIFADAWRPSAPRR